MRIFVGLSEVANVVFNYAKGFQATGANTLTVVGTKAWAYRDSTYDVVLDEDLGRVSANGGLREWLRRQWWRLRYYAIFLRAVATCDTFVFVFGSAFRAHRGDYALLKRLGKRIVCVFLGDDTRYWYAYTQEAELLGTADEIRPYLDEALRDRTGDYLAVKLATVRDAEAHADLILSLPEMAQLQTRPYMRVNIPIDLSVLDFRVHDRTRPLVVHAPSVRAIKGTDHVLAAVECLRAEGVAFDFDLIERLPNLTVRTVLADADILVDQLYSETIATLALEGLATGNVVLARYLPERSQVPRDCPVVNVNRLTLVERLREVIVNLELRARLARAGRVYVEKHHAKERVAREILDFLRSGHPSRFDFHPSFFREHFAMSPDLAVREADLLRTAPPHVKAVPLDDVRFETRGRVQREPAS